ncbi:hypothetical protein D9757_012465 [Collybiopsis confluens]|uniref:Uncharacterized protein n=1 Tax=Collybiopsis confluens TaxID=2823264 RepID=A0A8H5G184_9AGAR|nr:hypothetical protein D9757_012465 [Collybiopsis confluens]
MQTIADADYSDLDELMLEFINGLEADEIVTEVEEYRVRGQRLISTDNIIQRQVAFLKNTPAPELPSHFFPTNTSSGSYTEDDVTSVCFRYGWEVTQEQTLETATDCDAVRRSSYKASYHLAKACGVRSTELVLTPVFSGSRATAWDRLKVILTFATKGEPKWYVDVDNGVWPEVYFINTLLIRHGSDLLSLVVDGV